VRVLLTGNRGKIGRVVEASLRDAGHEVVGFDVAAGDDLRDAHAVRVAARGCHAVVHAGAIARDRGGSPEEIMATNVLGTWHVLLAAQEEGLERVVAFSSAQVFGTAQGERAPDYLPLDDDHPRRAVRPYGLSKRLGEDLCEAVTAATGIPTVCLRPFAVWNDDDYARVDARRAADPESEWTPFWEYGAFVDVRDVAEACLAALAVPDPGHARVVLCAPDISATAPSRELAARLLPDVPWRGGPEYDADPWRALVDSRETERVLGWRPHRRWSDR
jgi:nucleoside-diphosphate-sugar epimerase